MKSESIIDTSFDTKRAYHAMQAAQQIMQDSEKKMLDAKHKMTEIYNEIGDLQAQHDKLKDSKDTEWEIFSEEIAKMKVKIGEKIEAVKACNTQEENFRKMAHEAEEANDAELKSVYDESARFFSKLASQKMLERDDLIAKKRKAVSPDMSMLKEMREKLKALRTEQTEIVEQYHEAKNEFSLKKTSYDRMKAKYESMKNPDAKQDVSDFSSRPKTMEPDEDLLRLAGIPEEEWEDCTVSRRADGKIDIYHGDKKDVRHGHVIVTGNTIEYARKPEKTPSIINI